MSVKVTGLFDAGNDVLLVRGEIDGAAAEAVGWVSATEQHYPDGAYDGEGNRLENKKGEAKIKPGPMSSAERTAYGKRLLLEQNPPEPREL